MHWIHASVQSVILFFNHSRNHVLSFTFSFSICPVICTSVINTLCRLFAVPYFFVRSSGQVLTDTGDYLGFICTEGEGVGVYSCDGGGRGGRFFLAFSQTIPLPLSRFNTHIQDRLGTFETRMAARSAKRAINTLRSFFVQLFFIRRVPLCIETSWHLLSWRPSAVDFFLPFE